MINIADNFNLAGSTKPLDSRDEFNTLAAMKACKVCNELHICYNKETSKQYQYNSSNTEDFTTGKWREYTPGGGGGEGTITGATIGGNPVTESGGVLQLPAYPTVPITGIKDSNGNDINPLNGKVTLPAPPSVPITKIRVEGASSDLPTDEGRVVIPSIPVKGIQTSTGTALTPDPNSGVVTLPAIPSDPTTRINNAEKRIAALESELGGDPAPVVIPVSAINLPHTAGSTFTYDPDDTYVMNISDVQIATVCYPYDHTIGAATTSYLIFKAIDRDLYYVYTHNTSTDLCTYFEEKVFDELSHEEAKAVFEAGKYAVKQIINAATGEPRPLKYWKHGIPNVFVTPHGFPLRCTTMSELISGSRHYYTLLKCDENQRIFKYEASNNKWSLVSGGCFIKGDTNTGADYEKYDVYFDKKDASDVNFDNTISGLSANNVKTAIDETFTTLKHTSGTATVSNASFTLPSTVTGNTYYDITSTPITSLTIPSINSPYEIVIKFTTDSTNICTIAIPNNQKYIGDLSVDKDVTYIISIFNGVIVIAETKINS